MNKNLSLLFFAVVFSITSASAQFLSKGALIGGGSVSFTSTSYKYESPNFSSKNKQTSFSLAPTAEYFIVDNLGVGLILSASAGWSKSGGTTGTSSGVSIGPIARYYFLDNGLFAEGFMTYGASSTKYNTDLPPDTKSRQFRTGAGLGYSVRVNEFILLDPMVGYQFINDKNPDTDVTQRSGQLYLKLGFTMILKNN